MVTLIVLGAIALLAVFVTARYYRKPIKAVVQDVLRDVRDVFEPIWNRAWCVLRRWWIFLGPRVTNRAAIAMVFGDLAVAASGQDTWVFIATHPYVAGAVVVMNLLTPLTPVGAPTRVPPPLPGGGLVNPQAIT